MFSTTLEEQYNNALKKSGRNGCGTYQIIVVITCLCAVIGGGIVLFSLSLLEMMPRFECLDDKLGWYECSNSVICQGQNAPQIPYRIDY